jgi:hypothetical protein
LEEKYTSQVQFMSFGDEKDYHDGLSKKIPVTTILRSIEAECTIAPNRWPGVDLAVEYHYVVNDRSIEKILKGPNCTVVRDQGHAGFSLQKYCEHEQAKAATLTKADV